jgi:hypothetical protein
VVAQPAGSSVEQWTGTLFIASFKLRLWRPMGRCWASCALGQLTMTSVVVTVCTCRRPHGLQRLLAELRDIDAASPFSVVVVENDAGTEGLSICQAMTRDYPWPLTCVVEPEPGICHARNRAVAEALNQQPDFIAILDDDEWPCRSWLRELTRVQSETGADIIGGPVVPVPADASEHWWLLARHYGLMRDLPDGTACMLYGAGNFLARRSCFELLARPFDPAFNETGGEDLHFFLRLERLGVQMRWAANAIAYESVPPQRLTRKWLLARQVRRGFLNVRIQRMLDPSRPAEGVRLARSFGVLLRAGLRRLTAAAHAEPAGLLAELDWQYALGRVRGHRMRGALSSLVAHGGLQASSPYHGDSSLEPAEALGFEPHGPEAGADAAEPSVQR